MDKKLVQKQRMKKYFIDAAIQVIKEEGVSNLTVKKITDLAGYAQGTLYNYFENLNILLYYCAVEFLKMCLNKLLNEQKLCQSPKEKVIRSSVAYANYFISNPNIFQIVFLEDLGMIPKDIESEDKTLYEITLLSRNNLQECADSGLINKKDVLMKQSLIANTIHANMLFYIKQRMIMTQNDILGKIKSEVTYILEK